MATTGNQMKLGSTQSPKQTQGIPATAMFRSLTLSLLIIAGFYPYSEPEAAQLRLTWTDNSTDEQGFKIERRTGTEGSFAQVGTTGPNTVSFVDTALTDSTSYCYRVRAYRQGSHSDYSQTNCGVTQATDSDGDGLSDDQEINTYGTDPQKADTDGDGLTDFAEINQGSDPLDPNSGPNPSDFTPMVKLQADFDGDGSADIAIWNGTTGDWTILTSESEFNQEIVRTWGRKSAGDMPVPGDYDGDGKDDISVWRAPTGTWYILTSSSDFNDSMTKKWGNDSKGDIPVPGDYDGDGTTDFAVWRSSTDYWYVLKSSSGFNDALSIRGTSGSPADVPVPGDYDGDGTTDMALWAQATGVWHVLASTTQFTQELGPISSRFSYWGRHSAGDIPVPGDYDGDGVTDLGVWREPKGIWYILASGSEYNSAIIKRWGRQSAGDVPVPGDYDGDRMDDIAVWRPSSGMWYVSTAASNFKDWFGYVLGSVAMGDAPVTSSN